MAELIFQRRRQSNEQANGLSQRKAMLHDNRGVSQARKLTDDRTVQLVQRTNSTSFPVMQRKIAVTNAVDKSPVWTEINEQEYGRDVVKHITKQRNTAFVQNSATGPFYAEPITEATHKKKVGDVDVQIPINDKLEGKRSTGGYRLETGNERETDRAMVIAFHELGHALHLLKRETPNLNERVYHEVQRGGVRVFRELIPLEEALNVGFRDNPDLGITHHYHEMAGVYGLTHRPGDDITEDVQRRIGNRTHKENDFREALGRDIRLGYNTP